MFKSKKIKFQMINPSSKMALKMSCLQSCNGDVQKAEEIYRFLSDGIETMPDFDIQQPTLMQQATQTVGSIFSWIKTNKGDILDAVSLIQSMRTGQPISAPATPPTDVPPLPID